MIFDLKPIEDLSDTEIRSLVKVHVAEQQHLEFKVTVKHQEPSQFEISATSTLSSESRGSRFGSVLSMGTDWSLCACRLVTGYRTWLHLMVAPTSRLAMRQESAR